MTTTRILVSKSDTAVIECPKCKARKSIPVGQFKGNKHAMRAKCACSHVFDIELNYRRHFRKNIALDATYQSSHINQDSPSVKLSPQSTPGFSTTNCIVKDISFGGMSFETKGTHMIVVGSKLRISFNLDNTKKTPVQSEIIVKTVNGKSIGAEFVDPSDKTSELRFYLMP